MADVSLEEPQEVELTPNPGEAILDETLNPPLPPPLIVVLNTKQALILLNVCRQITVPNAQGKIELGEAQVALEEQLRGLGVLQSPQHAEPPTPNRASRRRGK